MTEATINDNHVEDIKGISAISGGDTTIQNIVINGVGLQDLLDNVSPSEIPNDSTDDRLLKGLENSRQQLKKLKRKLALLVLRGDRSSDDVVVTIRNIKMFGENIVNLIGQLSLRGVLCEHRPNDDYLNDINKIWHIVNTMKFSIKRICPHCSNKLDIKDQYPKTEMLTALKKTKPVLLIFDNCTKYKQIDNLKICRTDSIYCDSCKNPVCTYFSDIGKSMYNFIDNQYPD